MNAGRLSNLSKQNKRLSYDRCRLDLLYTTHCTYVSSWCGNRRAVRNPITIRLYSIPTTRRKPLLLKDLRRVFGAKFDVSAYAATTYEEFFLNPSYLSIANAVPN